MSVCATLEVLGLIALVLLVWLLFSTAWRFLYTSFIGHALGHTVSPKEMGKWAGIVYLPLHAFITLLQMLLFGISTVITGATDGIGKAYAEEVMLFVTCSMNSRSISCLVGLYGS